MMAAAADPHGGQEPPSFGGPMAAPGRRPSQAPGPGGPPPGAAVMDEVDRQDRKEESIEDLRDQVKKSRWNVFLYLGLAAIMFAFALIPLPVPAPWDDETVLSDNSDGGQLQQDLPFLFGLPIDGKDLTDIRLVLEVVPKDGGPFHVHVIEAHCGTSVISDEMWAFEGAVARGEKLDDNHVVFDDSVPGKTYEIEMKLDPGSYCLVIEYDDVTTHDTGSLEVTASVYGLREIGGGLGGLSLIWALFGFIGAQRKGKILKQQTEPRRDSMTVEDVVMQETTQAILSAGPAGPPSAAVSAPQQSPSQLITDPALPAAAPAQATVLNYIESGDGYYYILKDDNTFDSQPYVKQPDGTYLPFSG